MEQITINGMDNWQSGTKYQVRMFETLLKLKLQDWMYGWRISGSK